MAESDSFPIDRTVVAAADDIAEYLYTPQTMGILLDEYRREYSVKDDGVAYRLIPPERYDGVPITEQWPVVPNTTLTLTPYATLRDVSVQECIDRINSDTAVWAVSIDLAQDANQQKNGLVGRCILYDNRAHLHSLRKPAQNQYLVYKSALYPQPAFFGRMIENQTRLSVKATGTDVLLGEIAKRSLAAVPASTQFPTTCCEHVAQPGWRWITCNRECTPLYTDVDCSTLTAPQCKARDAACSWDVGQSKCIRDLAKPYVRKVPCSQGEFSVKECVNVTDGYSGVSCQPQLLGGDGGVSGSGRCAAAKYPKDPQWQQRANAWMIAPSPANDNLYPPVKEALKNFKI